MVGGGEAAFFRLELGLDSRGQEARFETLTPMFREMTVCRWLSIDHAEFLRKPFDEKIKWLFFEEMERRREEYFQKKQADHMRQEQAKMKAQAANRVRRK